MLLAQSKSLMPMLILVN